MPTKTPQRTSPSRRTGEAIVTLQTQMETLTQVVDTIQHQLLGNGKPGLLTQVPVLVQTQEQHSEMLKGMLTQLQGIAETQEETKEALKDFHTEVKAGLDAQKATMDTHLAPDNPQHETLAKSWREKPVQLMLAIITLFTVLHTLTPYFEQGIGWLKTLVH